ncbi:hypothetical protein Ae717Ps2_6437c [Pseudonocardia sp. Ae717_Ps2]|nr:hypothetical protein Ae717Ps2_6371c [Pseudonocardia sp. Ae717_Ps2]OLM28496.1 hypothetical protein Ae717Ps2_6392c [Pseudonocardia sp. Ae717_Ps2]OLM28541.1 hypothetical protein Ae717Ps2_6437c [Pseudonocardia sp. Ae717_Ps2]
MPGQRGARVGHRTSRPGVGRGPSTEALAGIKDMFMSGGENVSLTLLAASRRIDDMRSVRPVALKIISNA